MKKGNILKVLLSLLVAFVLTACGGSSSSDSGSSNESADGSTASSQEDAGSTESADGINIVATTTQVADLVNVIGGDHVNVTELMGPGVDPHGYEPTPSDIDAVNEAEVVAYNGLHLEAMFVDIFEKMKDSGKEMIVLEDAVQTDQVLDSEDESLDNDPHIWFSVTIWKQAAEHVKNRLVELDPDNEADYQANLDSYLTELDDLDAEIKEKVEEIPEESRYLVTAHDAFNYLGNEYGFDVVGIQGLNTQTEAGTGDISSVADLIVDHKIKAVFIESSVSDRNVQALVEAVEAKGGSLEIGGELFSDSLGSAEDGADTYITMYQHNIDTIVNALK